MQSAKCGAKTRSGEPCKSRAMPNGRCRMHGGTAARGPEHPSYTKGLHSRYMPPNLARRFEEHLGDPDALDLSRGLALNDALLAVRLESLDAGESGQLVRELEAIKRRIESARSSGNTRAVGELFNELLATIGRARGNFDAVAEVGELLDRRTRMVAQETRRVQMAKESLTIREADQFFGATLGAVRNRADEALTALEDGEPPPFVMARMLGAIRADVAAAMGVGRFLEEGSDASA